MSKATYDSTVPVSGSSPSSYNMRNVLQSLAQGDSDPLRPRAQASPNMTVAIAGTQVESYYHRVYNDYTEPLEFATQNSSTVVAPVSNSRIDILVVSGTTASGTLHWVTGAEGASPILPSIPEEMLPVCAIYCKITMDRILNYEEKDTDTTEGYLYRDLRPKIVPQTIKPLWETAGGDVELKTADDVDMQTKKLKNLVAGAGAADSIRYDQAMKTGDSAGGDLTGTYPNPTHETAIPKNIQAFTSSDTWTRPAGIDTVYVKVWGGGGGGGGTNSATAGGGGGGSGYSEGLIAVTGNVTVTVGAAGAAGSASGGDGGTSSFAGSTTIQATGGTGGAGPGTGGTAGVGSTGTANLTGGAGSDGDTSAASLGGTGGGSPMGGAGGGGGLADGTAQGEAGTIPGGGGGGGAGASSAGGAGGAGLVIVYY